MLPRASLPSNLQHFVPPALHPKDTVGPVVVALLLRCSRGGVEVVVLAIAGVLRAEVVVVALVVVHVIAFVGYLDV